MSGVINQLSEILSRFLGRVRGIRAGVFDLSRGDHQFVVEIDICPKKVWINTDETVADGCGNIPVNKVGCTLLPGRLVFDADIETDFCTVHWLATT